MKITRYRERKEMKYTINGYSQEKLLKNNLDLSDSLILRVLADIYSSNSKKIEYKIMNNDKYMWISYGYLFEQIPVIGSERTLVRKIDNLIEKGILKKELVTSKKGIKGRFLYVSFGEKYFELTEYSNNVNKKIEVKEKEDKVKKKPKDYRNNITGDLSKSVSDTIRKSNQLSLRLAMALDIKQVAILGLAKRCSNKLLNITLVPVYKEFGIDEKDLTNKL